MNLAGLREDIFDRLSLAKSDGSWVVLTGDNYGGEFVSNTGFGSTWFASYLTHLAQVNNDDSDLRGRPATAMQTDPRFRQ